jgi:hypothetical protein
MDTTELLKKLTTLKPLHHFDIEVENHDEEEAIYLFAECERRGLIPKWLDCETPTIRVTNCAGATKSQKAVARLNSKDLSHIHGLLLAAGISAMMKHKYKAFCDLFERERAKAKKKRDLKWEKIYRALAKANEMQVELTIQAIEGNRT